MHSIFACVNVWIHYIFRGGQSEGKYGELHSLHTLTIASHGAMSYLDTRHNFRHIISDFTAVSHLTMELAARCSRRPHCRSLQVSLSCPVLAVEYSTSCTTVQLYSVQWPPCAAVCSRPTALRSSVGNPARPAAEVTLYTRFSLTAATTHQLITSLSHYNAGWCPHLTLLTTTIIAVTPLMVNIPNCSLRRLAP